MEDVVVAIFFIVGLVACYFSGHFVGCLMKKALGGIDLVGPNGISNEDWTSLVSPEDESKAGRYLGFLERILAFVSLYMGTGYLAIIGGWLVFKVGSKWQAWSNIIRVPEKLTDIDEFSYLRARRRWGSKKLMGFLIGTLANILIGFGIAHLAKLLPYMILSLFSK